MTDDIPTQPTQGNPPIAPEDAPRATSAPISPFAGAVPREPSSPPATGDDGARTGESVDHHTRAQDEAWPEADAGDETRPAPTTPGAEMRETPPTAIRDTQPAPMTTGDAAATDGDPDDTETLRSRGATRVVPTSGPVVETGTPRSIPVLEDPTPEPGSGPSGTPPGPGDEARAALRRVREEVSKAVVGQEPAVSGLLIGLLAGGHVLLEGVPGVAKTLLVRALAAALSVQTKRVQFTPDLMPGDITGSLVYDQHQGDFTFREGPVFTNLLLADEINRTPPKTQAALLEAMAERQVTVEGTPHKLPAPFLVAATQNPIEYEGTYPLPEAQLDRFLLKLHIDLPERSDEIEVLRRHARGFDPGDIAAAGVQAVAGPQDLLDAADSVLDVAISKEVGEYIVDIVRATRALPSVALGVSPRGATALLATSRAWAWLNGRGFVTPDDVKALAKVTLAHRLVLRTEAELDGVTAADALAGAVASVTVPR